MDETSGFDCRAASAGLKAQSTQLLSLEVSLKQQLKMGQISEGNFEKRLDQLEEIRRRHNRFSRYVDEELNRQKACSDMELPPLESCSQQELIICRDFLNEKIDQTESLLTHLFDVYDWVKDASQGRGNFLLTTLRLSKLKKLRDNMELAKNNMISQRQKVKKVKIEFYDKLNLSVKTRNGVDVMLGLYKKIDYLVQKISLLKSKIASEKDLIARMSLWLKKYEYQKTYIPFTKAPTVQELNNAVKDSQEAAVSRLRKYDDRLKSAEVFVEHQVSRHRGSKKNLTLSRNLGANQKI